MAHGITAGAGPALPTCRSVAVRRRRVASLAVAGRLRQRGVAAKRRGVASPARDGGRRLNRRTCRETRSGRRSALRIQSVPAAMHGAISQDLCEIVPKRLSPAVHQTAQVARDPSSSTPRERYDNTAPRSSDSSIPRQLARQQIGREARNHTPMSIAAMETGAMRVTSASPTGDRTARQRGRWRTYASHLGDWDHIPAGFLLIRLRYAPANGRGRSWSA
jgi:hypothetical protein